MSLPVGHLKDHKLEEIWNGEEMRKLRQRMLADEPSPQCTRCYELEGVGFSSQRLRSNEKFAHHKKFAATTEPDGRVAKFQLPFFDIRFSNVCNFRCRSCGPRLSSSWFNDAKAYWNKDDLPRLQHATADPEDLWRQIDPLIEAVEEIYFAGGEPLLMDEHYRILDRLIELKRFDVRLRYNTNFSESTFKGRDVYEIWSRFGDVHVGASLDGPGARGEYIRKGQKWNRIVENRQRMMKVCPNVKFRISSTLSLMNVFLLPDFYREWVEAGYIAPSDFAINMLTYPTHLRAQLLPQPLKKKAQLLYSWHAETCLKDFGDKARTVARDFNAVIRFLEEQDLSHKLGDFVSFTQKLDLIRDERFTDVFPELAELMSTKSP